MELGFEILGFAFAILIMIFIIYKLRNLYLSEDKIEEEIAKHYEEKGLVVDYVSKLNMTERMKYGVPIMPIFQAYSYYFGILSGKIEYIRKVSVIDKKENEHIKYVELTVQGKDIISFNEFASYEL
jgi:hypothetical protein